MDLKEVLGDAYKEDMTLEEVKKELSKLDLIEKSELDKYVSKDKYDRTASECADWKKKYRTTLDESQQKELADKEKNEARDIELENLKREVGVSNLTAKHIGMGYDDKSASEIAKAMYEGDMEKVCTLQSSFIEKTRKEVQKQKQDDTPPPPGGDNGGDTGVTKEKWMKMDADERQKVYSENPELARSFYE